VSRSGYLSTILLGSESEITLNIDESPNMFCQLLDFETVRLRTQVPLHQIISIALTDSFLGIQFKIGNAYFQDPDFSATDIKFLEQRGHELTKSFFYFREDVSSSVLRV
jgi:hypothetical protein